MSNIYEKLKEEAALYAVSDNSSMLFHVWKDRYSQKLIESTVKECMHVAGEQLSQFGVTQIKDYFGVE
jgi:hypothetical protein